MKIKINHIEKMIVDDSSVDVTDPFLFNQLKNHIQISVLINGKISRIDHLYHENALDIEVQ